MRLKRRGRHDLVSWLCDLDRHDRCSGVVAVNPQRDGGPRQERIDGFGLRLCQCEDPGCTCRSRADLAGARAAILARQ